MITLKHYLDTNSVEVTWTDSNDIQVRCHSYDQTQMDMLLADLGTEAALADQIILDVQANWITPPIIPVIVPQRITNYQGKVTLDAFQLYEEVETYMSLPDTPRAAKLAWATGAFERQGTMVIAMAAKLGLIDEHIDNMFIYGAGVE